MLAAAPAEPVAAFVPETVLVVVGVVVVPCAIAMPGMPKVSATAKNERFIMISNL